MNSIIASNAIKFLKEHQSETPSRFADALGKRPNEITRWLSGEHNFTISTLAMLSSFFGQPIITVG